MKGWITRDSPEIVTVLIFTADAYENDAIPDITITHTIHSTSNRNEGMCYIYHIHTLPRA